MKKLAHLSQWVHEAQLGSKDWRAESWRDCEMVDGAQYTEEERAKLIDIGVDPKVINRTFPIIQLLLGLQSINKADIIAKPRTVKDADTGRAMTESIKFVMDQCEGISLIGEAYKDQVIPGFGFMKIGANSDPRNETVSWQKKDWKTIWWDAYSNPWLAPKTTRYVFEQVYMDLENLQALFPKRSYELKHYYNELKDDDHQYSEVDDEDWYREDLIREQTYGGKYWLDKDRKRVRPVEIWYPEWEESMFAIMPNGMVSELTDDMDVRAQFAIIQQSSKVVTSTVQKMKVCSFLGDLELQHINTPFKHDLYPYVPFVGYLDRFGHPYGVPRQIREQDKEINLRRSMSLAMLRSAGVVIEEGAVETQSDLQNVHDEANKIDRFIVVKDGKLDKIQLEERASLVPAQHAVLQQSEEEMQQVSGANNPSMGYDTKREMSGVTHNEQVNRSETILEPLFNNLSRSHRRVGELTTSSIKQHWTEEKTIRVTDELTGKDKIMVLNQMSTDNTGAPVVLNNITQHRYDMVIAQTKHNDTTRESNLNMVMEWIKRAPPEAIPLLFTLGIELSDLPNKDKILEKMRPLLGIRPDEDDMSMEDILQTIKDQQRDEQHALSVKETNSKIERNQANAEAERADAKKKDAERSIAWSQAAADVIERRKGNDSTAGSKTGTKDGKGSAKSSNDSKGA